MPETVPISGRFTLAESDAIDHYCKEAKISKTELIRRAVLQLLGLPRGEWKDGSRAPAPAAPIARIPPTPPGADVARRTAAARDPAGSPAAPSAGPVNTSRPRPRSFAEPCPRCHGLIRYASGELSIAREQHYAQECPVLHPKTETPPAPG